MNQSNRSPNLIGRIASYLQIVKQDPHSTAFVPLAEAYRQLGLLDDALETARMGTDMLPNFSPGFTTLGRVLAQMGRTDEAMSAFKKALDIDRQSQSALVGLARLYLVRSERAQARSVLNQAMHFHPDDQLIRDMLAAIDMPSPWRHPSTSPTPAAKPAITPIAADRSAEPAISIPIPTATLAEIYVQQGLTDQAAHVYAEILRADPDNAVVARRLAELRGWSPAAPPLPQVPDTPPPGQPSAARLLQVFEGWLQAIQIRRAHVQ
jgi:tetratricopeptide (TPR) repeat protein